MTFLVFNAGAGESEDQPSQVVDLLDASPAIIENPISSIISEYLPDFISDNHAGFIDFIEAYYEWMERKENPYGTSATLMDTLDVDRTLDSFIDYFKETYLNEFPKAFATSTSGDTVNQETVLKNITDFYASKGTEKAYKFLFRILYDSEVDFYYPKQDILRVSDGKWVEKKSIKITSNNGTSNFSMKNKTVEQIDSDLNGVVTAYANVDSVYQYDLQQYKVTELFLTDINGTFVQGSDVRCTLDDETILVETLYSIPSEILIANGGASYRSGDGVIIDEESSSFVSGVGAKGSVGRTSLDGVIRTAQIDNFGVNYKTSNNKNTLPIAFKSSSGNGASGEVNLNALCEYPGYFANNDGKLSSNKRIRDNDLYQEYSYILKTSVSLSNYKNQIKNLVHPTGTKLFGNISIFDSVATITPYSTELNQSTIPLLGRYAPYTLDTHDDLRGATGSGSVVDLYPRGFQPGSTATNHCLGNTGGRLSIKAGSLTGGYTLGSFRVGESITGSSGGATGSIFGWSRNTATGGAIFLYTQATGGAIAWQVGEEIEATGGMTGIIEHVTMGNGTVLESDSYTHVTGPNGGLTAGATAYGLTAHWEVASSPIIDSGGEHTIDVQTFSESISGYTSGYDFSIGNVILQGEGDYGNLTRGIVKDWIPGISGGTGNTLKIQLTSGNNFTGGTFSEINNHNGIVTVVYGMTGGRTDETIRNKIKHLTLDNTVQLSASWQFLSDHGYTV